jgi:hypothetical protein
LSIQAVSWVLRHCEATGGARCLMFAIANHSDEHGRGCWASVETLAHEARMSARGARAALRRLEVEGELVETGVTETGTHVYELARMGGEDSSGGAEDRDIRGGEATSPEVVSSVSVSSSQPDLSSTVQTEPSSNGHVADIERLCQQLADSANERSDPERRRKRPKYTVTKTWREAMRRLVEIDGREPGEVERAIRWVHQHDFWSSNIFSPVKLRLQYDVIRGQAQRERNGRRGGSVGPSSDDYRAMAEQARREGQ